MAFVSGGGSAAGLASARSFAHVGIAVAVVDVDASAAKFAAARLVAEGHRAIAIACDVANEDEVENAIALTLEQFGSIDFAFNYLLPQAKTWPSTWEPDALGGEHPSWILRNENLCMKHQLLHMRKRNEGLIVNRSAYSDITGAAAGPSEGGGPLGFIAMENVSARHHNNGVRAFTLYEKSPNPFATASMSDDAAKRLKAPGRRADLRCPHDALAAAVLDLCDLSGD